MRLGEYILRRGAGLDKARQSATKTRVRPGAINKRANTKYIKCLAGSHSVTVAAAFYSKNHSSEYCRAGNCGGCSSVADGIGAGRISCVSLFESFPISGKAFDFRRAPASGLWPAARAGGQTVTLISVGAGFGGGD